MEKWVQERLARLTCFFCAVVLSSCTEQPFPGGNVQVETRFRLQSSSALGGKINIQEAYLKLSHVQITGSSGPGNTTNVTHAIAQEEPPYQLTRADSGKAIFGLPFPTYEQLDFDLFLYQDAYQLTFTSTPGETTPDPPADNGGEQNNSDDNNNGESDGGQGSGGENDDNDDDDRDDGNRDDDDHDDGDDDRDDDDRDHDKDDKKKKKNKNKGNNDDRDDDDDDRDDDDSDDDDDGRTGSARNQEVLDLDHFFQNAKPAMAVFATYQNNGQTTSIIFVVSGVDKFSLRAQQNDSDNILLGRTNLAEVVFDPDQWFGAISDADISVGSQQTYQGQQVLFIHKDYNTALYEKLLPRLQQSAALTFSLPAGI